MAFHYEWSPDTIRDGVLLPQLGLPLSGCRCQLNREFRGEECFRL